MSTELNPTLEGKDGLDISLEQATSPSQYTWDTTIWNVAEGSFPSLIQPEAVVYPINPIDFEAFNVEYRLKNGHSLSTDEILVATTYTSNEWSLEVWNVVDGENPILKSPESPTYQSNPIVFDTWIEGPNKKDGGTITTAMVTAPSTYSSWDSTVWNVADGELPSLNIPASLEYEIHLINYEYWEILSEIFNGIKLKTTDLSSTHYTNNGWSTDVWNVSTPTSPSLKDVVPGAYETHKFDFTVWIPTHKSKDGQDMVATELTQKSTYQRNMWQFGIIWNIVDGHSIPGLITPLVFTPISDPATAAKYLIPVEESVEGSILYDDKVYRAVSTPIQDQIVKGDPGQEIVFSYEGEKVKADGEVYEFMVSGIGDTSSQSKFTDLQPLTTREVTLTEDAAKSVGFFYVKVDAPAYDYLFKTNGPEGFVHLAIMKSEVSDIKVVMPNGEIGFIDVVATDDPDASPIRIMTQDGIFALRQVEPQDTQATV